MGHVASDASSCRWTRGANAFRWFAALCIAACAGACVDQTPILFRSRPTRDLCIIYHLNTVPQGYSAENLKAIHKLLDDRGAVGPGEWQDIENHRLRLGLGGCAVLAILGEPVSTTQKGPVETLTFAGNRVVTLRDDKAISIAP